MLWQGILPGCCYPGVHRCRLPNPPCEGTAGDRYSTMKDVSLQTRVSFQLQHNIGFLDYISNVREKWQLKFWHQHGDKTCASEQWDSQPGPFFQKHVCTQEILSLKLFYFWSYKVCCFHPFFTIMLLNYLHALEEVEGEECCFLDERGPTWKAQEQIVGSEKRTLVFNWATASCPAQ